jgi:hypothetical protein
VADLEGALQKINYTLKEKDIVLIQTGASAYNTEQRYLTHNWRGLTTRLERGLRRASHYATRGFTRPNPGGMCVGGVPPTCRDLGQICVGVMKASLPNVYRAGTVVVY